MSSSHLLPDLAWDVFAKLLRNWHTQSGWILERFKRKFILPPTSYLLHFFWLFLSQKVSEVWTNEGCVSTMFRCNVWYSSPVQGLVQIDKLPASVAHLHATSGWILSDVLTERFISVRGTLEQFIFVNVTVFMQSVTKHFLSVKFFTVG